MRELREREIQKEGRDQMKDGGDADWDQSKDWVRHSMEVVNNDRREGRGRGLHRQVLVSICNFY